MDYESEYKELLKTLKENREAIMKKYESYYENYVPIGLDGGHPDDEELKCENIKFYEKVAMLREKYNKEPLKKCQDEASKRI